MGSEEDALLRALAEVEEEEKSGKAEDKPEEVEEEEKTLWEKLRLGMIGIVIDTIPANEWGFVLFEVEPKVWKRVKVYAVEEVREHMRCIIVSEKPWGVMETSPEELKFEREDGTWQRVTELMPLPIDGATALPASKRATASGDTEVKAPSSGKKLKVKYVEVFNSGATSVTVYLKFGTGGDPHFRKNLAPQTGFNANLVGTNWRGGLDEALYVNLSPAGTYKVDVTVFYQEE